MMSQRTRRMSWLILALLPALAVQPCPANDRYDAWQAQRPFTLSTWISRPYSLSTQEDVDYFLGSGLNTFWDGVRSGSSAWDHTDSRGLPTLLMAFQAEQPDLQGFIADFEEARATHQNIVGVMLGDEVRSVFGEGGLQHMGQVRDWIVNNPDPTISSLLTLTSVPSGDTATFDGAVPDYYNRTFEVIRPDVVVAQMYPIGATFKPTHYSGMEWYFQWAREKGVGMWIYPQVYSSSRQGVPSESELRLQRFTALAYGVRGFVDFLYHADGGQPSVFGAGYYDGSGEPTQLYRYLAVINREVAQLGTSLLALTPVRAYHMDGRDDGDGVRHWSDADADLPPWQQRTWKLANVTGAENRNHLLVGIFRDAAGEEYFMVVNKDYAKDRSSEELATPVTLTFHPSVKGIERLNRQTGEVEKIAVRDNHTFMLPGGTGDLFKFATGAPFAGKAQPVRPRLLGRDPTPQQTLGRVANNEITLQFDRNAANVFAAIEAVDAHGVPTAPDLSPRFTRQLTDGGRTLVYRENGTVLTNRATYTVVLHHADAEPITLTALRGDVLGDGQVTAADLESVKRSLNPVAPHARADVTGDGRIDEADVRFVDKVLNFKPYQWVQDFAGHAESALPGQGPWLAPVTLPGTVLDHAWVSGPMSVTRSGAPLGGHAEKAAGAQPFVWYACEALFHKEGGFDGVGVLRVSVVTRVGPGDGYQNTGLHVWSSTDAQGEHGTITVEQHRTGVSIVAGRGIKLDAPQSVAVKGGQSLQSKGIRVEWVLDFEAAKLTWSVHDLDHDERHGPFEVGYTGTPRGLDALSIIGDTAESQVSGISVKNH